MTPPKVCKNFINGEWIESASEAVFEDRNPADIQEIAQKYFAASRRTIVTLTGGAQ